MLDDACDQIGKRFLSDRLPPELLEPERVLTKEAFANNAANYHDAAKKIWPNTLCRLARPGIAIARLVIEESQAVLYHCYDNSRVYHGTPLSPMEFEIDDAPAIEQLLTTVEPRYSSFVFANESLSFFESLPSILMPTSTLSRDRERCIFCI
jgi:lysine-specific demethylase/histidyl-hydroxylase NO66